MPQAALVRALAQAHVSPVLTAHPTEVQRQSILDAERAIAQLIAERADATKPNMGLTSWKGAKVRKADVTVLEDVDYSTCPMSDEAWRISAKKIKLDYESDRGSATHAVLPYDHALATFPDYLQQLEMESNGKRYNRHGAHVDYPTAPVLWGEAGRADPLPAFAVQLGSGSYTLYAIHVPLAILALTAGAFVTGATMANFSSLAAARHAVLEQIGRAHV